MSIGKMTKWILTMMSRGEGGFLGVYVLMITR